MDTLKVASDFSYAFHLSQNEHFVKLIQTIVRRDPANLEKVGSLLTKMRSVLQSVCDKKADNADKEGASVCLVTFVAIVGSLAEETGKSGLNSYYESQLKIFAERIFDHVPDCAHRLSVALLIACLIKLGVYKSVDEGEAKIKAIRPKIRLNARQRKEITKWMELEGMAAAAQ